MKETRQYTTSEEFVINLLSVAVLILNFGDGGPVPILFKARIQTMYSINFRNPVRFIWLSFCTVLAVETFDSEHHNGLSSGHFTIW